MRHAKPINAELLHRLLSACAGPSLMDLRNQALLRIAHDTLLRRSELVSLRIEDLEIRSDQTAGRILLRRFKTDQSALGRYHAASSMAGLSNSRVPRIIRGLARKAGLKPEQIKGLSGHSLRIGAAQALAQAGEGLPLLLTRGGWTKPDTVLRYIEQTPLEPHLRS
jgi:integrase